MVRPFYNLENSCIECRCKRCGCLIGRGVLRMVSLQEAGILRKSWKKKPYCLDCAIELLSETKELGFSDVLSLSSALGKMYSFISEVNALNGYSEVLK